MKDISMDYNANEIKIPEDWVEVFYVGEWDYEWWEMRAYYSPKERRYFWADAGGCSCNEWDVTIGEYCDGSKADLIRDLRKDENLKDVNLEDAVAAVYRFDPKLYT